MNQSTRKEKTVTNEKRSETSFYLSVKSVQYLMLAMLLILVFLVSAYAGTVRRRQNAGGQNKAAGTDRPGDLREEGGDGASGQTESSGESEAAQTKGTIVLDAGHGGMDPGVSGASGVSERELNLVFAGKLGALLEKEGYRVVQTRTTQAGLYDEGQTHKKAQDMQRRCAVIEKERPLVTVSIHQNSYPDASVSGPQVFYFAQSKEGERLAASIQDCMNEQLEVDAPKTQKGNSSYYILRRSVGTTVIVECGFLTNPSDEAKLQQEEYQDRVAQAICDGILRYLEEKTPAA